MKELENTYIKKYIFLGIFSFIFLLSAIFFFYKCINATKPSKLEYSEVTNIDYNVCLKDNIFFEDKCLSKEYLSNGSKSIVTKIIDNIYVNFNYNMKFSEPITGKYTYYIKGIIEANKNQESGNYWSKEYNLSEKEEVQIENSTGYLFSIGTVMNYDQYNNLLTEFKQDMNVSIDGVFKVVLVVESNINNGKFEENQIIATDALVEIPLTKASTELNVNLVNGSKNGSIDEDYSINKNTYNKFLTAFIVSIIVMVLNIIFIIIVNIQSKRNKKELIRINKILKTYDSIIVNVNSLPDTKNYNVIKVNSFEELIDAHSEVRLPINYYNNKTKHYFILVNNDIAWIYETSTKVKR